MERRGPDRDTRYIPPESPVKLPLAPIVSTPPDRRGVNTMVSVRRGSAIFSPTQTLDHHRHHLSPPPRPPHVLKNSSTDPDPSSPTADGQLNLRTPASPPPQLQAAPPPEPSNSGSVRYRECLKNHAATMGGRIVDGCGEFMPNGEDGTAESLRCAACDCHRNFHRKEIDGEARPSNFNQMNPNSGRRAPFLHSQTPPLLATNHQHKYSHSHPGGAAAPAMMSFGGNSGGRGGDESSSEDLGSGHAAMTPSSRKRFRTKFSQEQKDRMQEVAEKLGWRIQKEDEEEVQRLCSETGVKREVFKVWMHNNKQAIKKRQINS